MLLRILTTRQSSYPRNIESVPQHFHLNTLTHSAIFLSVSWSVLLPIRSTSLRVVRVYTSPHLDRLHPFSFETTTTSPRKRTFFVMYCQHQICLIVYLFISSVIFFFSLLFSPHRSSERVPIPSLVSTRTLSTLRHIWSHQQVLYHIWETQTKQKFTILPCFYCSGKQ